MKHLKVYWIALVVIVLDQLTKSAVRSYMELHQSVEVLGNFFRITFIENPGAAFSLSFGDDKINFIILSAASFIAVGVIVYLIRNCSSKTALLSYNLILGGALGNLIDRLIFGKVTDFLDFDFFDFIISRWPVFNIADSSIVCGVLLLIFYTIFIESKIQTQADKSNR